MTYIIHEKIRILEIQLRDLDIKKASLQAELKSAYGELEKNLSPRAASHLSPEEKVKIFMNLFRGRMDVFPKRWDNLKTGKSGYMNGLAVSVISRV